MVAPVWSVTTGWVSISRIVVYIINEQNSGLGKRSQVFILSSPVFLSWQFAFAHFNSDIEELLFLI